MLGNARAAASLPAVDMERAVKFYSEVVGLEQVGGSPEDGSVMFKAGDGAIVFIYQRGEATKAEHTALNFYIDAGIEDIVKGMTDKGAVFEQYDMGELKTDELGIAPLGETKGAWFKDTESNIIGIFQGQM
ncbi:MAG: VOC family protein [Chloroflexi bacterium]|nr:VOC family protein [Chloroflexota bacterium]